MWTFRGPQVIRRPSKKDTFSQALEDLDNIPLTYNPNRKDRISGYEEDFPTLTKGPYQGNHPLSWGSGDTASTLKPVESDNDVDHGVDDVETEEETPKPPVAVGFWHLGLRETRWIVLKKYSWTCRYKSPSRRHH